MAGEAECHRVHFSAGHRAVRHGKVNPADVPKPTNEEMQNEYDYFLAEQLTKKLLDKGLITDDEFEKIMAKNRKTFSPYISKIMP